MMHQPDDPGLDRVRFTERPWHKDPLFWLTLAAAVGSTGLFVATLFMGD